MKKVAMITLAMIMISLSGCQVVGGIFKAGVWVGILFVVAIIAVIIFVFAKIAGK